MFEYRPVYDRQRDRNYGWGMDQQHTGWKRESSRLYHLPEHGYAESRKRNSGRAKGRRPRCMEPLNSRKWGRSWLNTARNCWQARHSLILLISQHSRSLLPTFQSFTQRSRRRKEFWKRNSFVITERAYGSVRLERGYYCKTLLCILDSTGGLW